MQQENNNEPITINWKHSELIVRTMIQEFKKLCAEENGRILGEIDLGVLLDDKFGKPSKKTKTKI